MDLPNQIANALGRGKKTPGGWLCQCPCHEDKESSLSVKLTQAGKIAVNCFAGCTWQTIYAELRSRNLLPAEEKRPKPQGQWSEIQKIYSYTDEFGKELFQKVRTATKKGIHRHLGPDGKWIWNIQGVRNVLYNLPKVIESPLVYICEGEKDADTLNAAGLVATTNNCGAVAWQESFTPFLKDKKIVICQDNDDAGKKRTRKLVIELSGVVKELRIFEPPNVPDHGDVTDWAKAGNDPLDIFRLSRAVTPEDGKGQKATRDQYFELFNRILGNPRKCIFSEKLMSHDADSGLWNPAVNLLELIKSEAAVVNEGGKLKFSLSLVQPHFFAFEATKRPEFLVQIPEWDGDSRILAMAALVTLKKEAGVDEYHFSELLKEWCGTMFRRLYDPMIQNKILVLQGGQGVGKDTWISMLLDGLGQFSVPLSVVKDDKDTFLNLHRGLVMKISEFDKTAKTETSILKDIITTPNTNIRAPYDRDAKLRHSRCSFVSSANIENILRDHTGNRRFLVFEVESIDYAYRDWPEDQKREWQMQCLAEAKWLADNRYQASAEATASIKDYIQQKTPDDPAEDTVREYEAACTKVLGFDLGLKSELTETEITEIVAHIKQRTGGYSRAIRQQLRRRVGVYNRTGDKAFWTYKVPSKMLN